MREHDKKRISAYQSRLQEQDREINALQQQVERLEKQVDCTAEVKDIRELQETLKKEIAICREKSKQYDELIREVKLMRKEIRNEIFKGNRHHFKFLKKR